MGLPEFAGARASPASSAWPSAPGSPSRWSTTARTREDPIVTIPYEFTATSIKAGDVVTVLDTEGEVLGNVEVDAGARAEDRRPGAPRARAGAPGDRQADRRHPRAGAVGHRAGRRESSPTRRRRDRLPLRARDGGRDPRAHPRGRARPEPPQGRHPRRHGRLRREDLPEPHRAHLPRGGRRGPRRSPSHACGPLFMEVPLGAFAGVSPTARTARATIHASTPPTRTGEACDEHAGLSTPSSSAPAASGSRPPSSWPKRACRPLVIDQFPAPARAATRRPSAASAPPTRTPAKIRLCLDSLQVFSTWKETHGDDIELAGDGYVFVAYRDREEQALKELLRVQQAARPEHPLARPGRDARRSCPT